VKFLVEAHVSEPMQRAKRPASAALAGPYGHPFHPILVTVPIGAWTGSLVFDVASYLVASGGFLAQGSQWLIGLGVLAALAAAVVGFLDLTGIPAQTRARRIGVLHMSLNLGITTAYAINYVWRPDSYDQQSTVAVGPLVLSALSIAVLGLSGYLGGMLAYRYGVRVVDEAAQADGYRSGHNATEEQPWNSQR
jgi:uncharacterized membrane protein